MEIKEILENNNLVGVISSYKHSLDLDKLVSELEIKNSLKAFKMVGLDSSILDKKVKDLSFSELFKVDLATKLTKDVIIVGNMSKYLNNKEINYMQKLFLKLSNEYHKKIIIIDKDVQVFFDLVKKIVVLKNKKIIYMTSDFYDNELYKYTKMPPIVEFIKYINRDKKRLNETTDILELIKDVYRSVS